MIKSLDITSFRQHKNLTFNFCPGVNVIAGDSAAGKSAALRALRWTLLNKPQGNSIFPQDDTLAEVSVRIDSHQIARKRTSSINQYDCNGNILKSFKTNVPEDIQKIVNLEDFNFQLQFDKYFLLEDSAGEVAAKLNDVADLSIIDTSIQKVNKILVQSNTEAVTQQIEELTQQILDYETYETELDLLTSLINKVKHIEIRKNKVQDLQSLCSQVKVIEQSMQSFLHNLPLETQVKDLQNKFTALTDRKNNLQYLQSQMKSYKAKRAEIELQQQKITRINIRIEEQKKILNICPTCGRAYEIQV